MQDNDNPIQTSSSAIRTVNTSQDQNSSFQTLLSTLQSSYPVFDISLLLNQKDFSYQMTLNSILPEDIINEIEAQLFNYSTSSPKQPLTSQLLNEWLLNGLSNRIKVSMTEQRKQSKNTFNQKNQPAKRVIKSSIISPGNLKIKSTLAYPDKDNHLHIPSEFNSNSAIVQFYPDYEIKEYPLIPKDEWESEDKYLKFFMKMRSFLLLKLKISEDDPLINITKFVLIVCFETTDSKPISRDVRLVDPLNNFVKYRIKNDKEFPFKNYLVSGQMLYVEGDFVNDEVIIKQFSQGFPIESYIIHEEGLKPFFTESAPYLFYSVNGPYSSIDDINLSLYTQTLLKMSESNPHCILLNGPFIHTENEQIKSGEIDMSYFTLFENMMEIINKIYKDKRTIILIAPSLSDVLNYYPIPQPPFNLSEMTSITKLDIYKAQRLRFISNPYIFQLNEMIIGLANFDFIKDITLNCIRLTNNKAPIDIGLETVIEQNSFYPLLQNTYNGADELKMDKMTIVDIGQYERLVFEASPDVIITSSSMNPFAKKIHSTLFINSGGLYKGMSTGSYSRIISFPPSSFVGNDIFKRLRVDLCKIELPPKET